MDSAPIPFNADMLVALNLRRIRTEAGLTQEKLSELSGVSKQHISRIERCGCSPTVAMLSQLADALEIWPGALLDSPSLESFKYFYTYFEPKVAQAQKKPAQPRNNPGLHSGH